MEQPYPAILQLAALATFGDVVLTLIAYGAVAAVARDQDWLRSPSRRQMLLLVASGLAMTVVLEALMVYVWARWAYQPVMPLVFGIGLAPLVQWMLLPPLTLWLARRHLEGSGEIPSRPLTLYSGRGNTPHRGGAG